MDAVMAVLMLGLFAVAAVLGWLVREVVLQRRALAAVGARTTKASLQAKRLGVKVRRLNSRVDGVELDLTELLVDGDELRDRIGQVERISEGQGIWIARLQDWLCRIDRKRRPAGLPADTATEVVKEVGGDRTMRWDEVRVGAKG